MKAKTALVTGGSRGIGRGITEALAREGWKVAINYRSDEKAAQSTVQSVKLLGGEAFAVQTDIRNLGHHDSLLQTVIERTGRIDLLVNNAGMAPPERADILELKPENYDLVMETNLRGPFFLTQSTAGIMIELVRTEKLQSPSIINISSISAGTASVSRGEYCISKAGLSMTTALWAARLAEYGIHVYEIRPGMIKTDMTAAVREKYDRLINDGLTLTPRWGSPEDIGKAVVSLAEGWFPYSTGETFHIDGGLHVSRL